MVYFLNSLFSGPLTFSISDGFLDGVVRGYKAGLLRGTDYQNLSQCERLDDIRLHLSGTDWGNFLQNEPSPLQTQVVAEKCVEEVSKQWTFLRRQATGDLAKFMDYCVYGYMIDNCILLIRAAIHGTDGREILESCHPLGMFEQIETITAFITPREVYDAVLYKAPIGPYFKGCLDIADLEEMHIEMIRTRLYKRYLEDFYSFVNGLGGITAELMAPLLEFEADRRAINITVNSFGTDFAKSDRKSLFCEFGSLYPSATFRLSRCDDVDQVREVLTKYRPFNDFFVSLSAESEQSLEDCFFGHEVSMNRRSFDQQFHFATFYSWLKLKEQEVRNLLWISECVVQNQRSQINKYITIF